MRPDSRLEAVLAGGGFAVTAESGPPRGADPEAMQRKAALLRGAADAVNVTDNQTAVVRMSSLAASLLLLNHGVDPVVQMTTRDRNRIALQSDALGAAAMGVRNVLCLSGDHQAFGDHPDAKGVFDLDSVQLVAALKALRDEGRLLSGREVTVRPRLFIGAVENPFGQPVDVRVARLAKKIAAGADFIQTQCVFNVPAFREWMAGARARGFHERAAILAGVTPLKSARMAEYMATKVPGLDVPAPYIARMRAVPKERMKEEGVTIALEIIEELRAIPGVRGVHVMAIEWEEIVAEVVSRAGLLPRPLQG